jgi:hypothetical protein
MTPDRHTEIAKRAFTMREQEGRPTGRDLEHWLRAEAELEARQHAQTAKEAAQSHGVPRPNANGGARIERRTAEPRSRDRIF